MIRAILCCGLFMLQLHAKEPFEAKFGLYINDIYNIDVSKKTVDVLAYAWWNTPETNPSTAKMKVVNAIESGIDSVNFGSSKDKKQGSVFASLKIRAKVNMDSSNYPFDRHKLFLVFENPFAKASEQLLKASNVGPFVAKDLMIDGWEITGTNVKEEKHVYSTNFGEESAKQNAHSRLVYEIDVKRDSSWYIFLREYSGFYLGFLIIVLGFLVPTRDQMSRISLSLAAMFAIFTTHRFTISTLNCWSFSLTDAISLSSFLAAIASIYVCVFAGFIKNDKVARTYDLSSFAIVVLTYLSYNILMITKAIG
jgi:hypothetical protein